MPYSKRVKRNREQLNRNTELPLSEAISTLKKTAPAKFNETVEVAVRLGVDPKKADQIVRGTVVLPHGTGKTVRVVAVTKTKISEAQDAGADHVCVQVLEAEMVMPRDGWRRLAEVLLD